MNNTSWHIGSFSLRLIVGYGFSTVHLILGLLRPFANMDKSYQIIFFSKAGAFISVNRP